MGRSEKSSILSVYCPLIDRKVVLYRQTWEEHIIPQHPEVRQHLNLLIKETLEKPNAKVSLFSNIQNHDESLIYKECHYFLPLSRYLKMAVKLTKNKRIAIIKTIFHVYDLPKKGVMPYGCK